MQGTSRTAYLYTYAMGERLEQTTPQVSASCQPAADSSCLDMIPSCSKEGRIASLSTGAMSFDQDQCINR